MSKEPIVDVLAFLVFAGISVAVKYLEWKKKAPKRDHGSAPAPLKQSPAGPPEEAQDGWEPDYGELKRFVDEQVRAGRPVDPGLTAALEAMAPREAAPEVPAGPSEAELAILEEQRRLADLAARLEKRRADAAAAFAAAPENAAYAVDEESAAEAERGIDAAGALLRSRPGEAVILAEILAPPVALRSGASR